MNMISDTIKYIGVDDLDIDLFESQYVVPEGMSVARARSGRPTCRQHSTVASPTIWWLTTWSPTMQHSSQRCWRPIPACNSYAVPQP